MNAGRLRHRVTVQQKSVARTSSGAENVTWTNVGTFWARVQPLQGREYMEGRAQASDISTRILLRFQPGTTFTDAMRATWDGHTYQVVSVIEPDEARRELVLMCRELT